MPSHYPNQCQVIADLTPRNKLQWSFNQNTKLFIHENASENIVCEMAAIFLGFFHKTNQREVKPDISSIINVKLALWIYHTSAIYQSMMWHILILERDKYQLVIYLYIYTYILHIRVYVYQYMFKHIYPFYPRPILAFMYCHRLCLCVCQCVCVSLYVNHFACPRDNWWPVQARIPKFGPKMQKTLVKVPIVLGAIDLDLHGQI